MRYLYDRKTSRHANTKTRNHNFLVYIIFNFLVENHNSFLVSNVLKAIPDLPQKEIYIKEN